MKNFKRICLAITKNKVFEIVIVAVIILNSILIGVETYNSSEIVRLIQRINLGVFTIEIILRFIASGSIRRFIKDG